MARTAALTDSRADYACEPQPLGRGGYAEVFAATHKPTGRRVAFKRLKPSARWSREDALPRMRREIDVMGTLADHPHVMPVLAADPKHRWYAMPLAEGDLAALRDGLSDDELCDVLRNIAHALDAAHGAGLVHRDVTPMNILLLEDDERWVLADWGLVRRPRGHTTTRLTSSRHPIGTEGFIAPELLRGAHRGASAASDVFSLGRVVAWAATGRVPLAGEDLLPPGAFRRVVREATRPEPRDRCSLEGFVELLDEVGYSAPLSPHEIAQQLARDARKGDRDAGARLLEHADEHRDDQALFFDLVPSARGRALEKLASADPAAASRLAVAMRDTLVHGDWGRRRYDAANSALGWLADLAGAAREADDFGLLEDVADALFESAGEWQRFKERDRTRRWLNSLDGDEAKTVARALRRHPRAADWYTDEGWRPSSRMHRDLRAALGA